MKKSNVFLLSTLVIMASLFSKSHSLLSFLGLPIGQINIRGTLRCSLTGDPNAPPVPDAPVVLVCAGTNTTIAQALTDPTGVFNFTLNSTDALLFDPNDCRVTANLPVGNCSLSPPDGVLAATIGLFNYSITSFFAFLNYFTGTFLVIFN